MRKQDIGNPGEGTIQINFFQAPDIKSLSQADLDLIYQEREYYKQKARGLQNKVLALQASEINMYRRDRDVQMSIAV